MDPLAETIGTWFGKLGKRAGRLGVPPGCRADVAQEATLRLLGGMTWLAQLERPEGGAMKVVRHEAAREQDDERRRAAVRTSFDARLVPDPPPSPEAQVRRQQQRDLLAKLLKRLEKPHRRLVFLHDLKETPLSVIAAKRNLKLGTVKTRYRQAKARLEEVKAEWKAAEERAGRDGGMPCVPMPLFLGRRPPWKAALRDVGSQVFQQVAFALIPAALFCGGDAPWRRTDPPLPPVAVRASSDATAAPEPAGAGEGSSRHAATTDASAAPREVREATRDHAAPPAGGTPSTPGDADASSLGASAVHGSSTAERSLLRRAWIAIEQDTPLSDNEAHHLLEQHGREFPRGRSAGERANLVALLRIRADRPAKGP